MKQIRIEKLKLVLIKPSKYDDDGYVIRFWKGVLPSNTLAVLNGLTGDVKKRKVLGDIEIEVHSFDETVQKIPVKKIIRWSKEPNTKLLAALVGVQTNQFPRALDLGLKLRAADIDVIIGGFHVSGSINVLGEQLPEIQELISSSISIVTGEIEGHWDNILLDAINGQLKSIYAYGRDLKRLPDISNAPMPLIDGSKMKHFAYKSFGTLDTSRGCPFSCGFCTIVNVQGRKLRERSSEKIVELIRKNYREYAIDYYFFTDDNFARKKYWRETFDGIIKLQSEGIHISFMMQVDLAKKPRDFVKLAAEAGCSQVFIGMESVNPKNLEAEGKKQNKTEEYKRIIEEWHSAGVAVHAAYIIGFPYDTKVQVSKDIQYIMNKIEPDQISFFMLTPLPGSKDHLELKNKGAWMDPDFNKRDSFHPTTKHPRMSSEEWMSAYEDAWEKFYSKENLIKIAKRWNQNKSVYWSLMSTFFWYKNAFAIEKTHPMIAGFLRSKDRRDRRPGYAVDSLAGHYWKRTKEMFSNVKAWGQLLFEMEEIWLQSRKRTEKEVRCIEKLQSIQGSIWQTLRVKELQDIYAKKLNSLPIKASGLFDQLQELSSRVIKTPRDLDRFLKQWRVLQDHVLKNTKEGKGFADWCKVLRASYEQALSGKRIQEWNEAYSQLKNRLPLRLSLANLKFDTLSNQVIYSRAELDKFWCSTFTKLKEKKFLSIRPIKLASVTLQDLILTIGFVLQMRAHLAR